jgi:hypothetical protein
VIRTTGALPMIATFKSVIFIFAPKPPGGYLILMPTICAPREHQY